MNNNIQEDYEGHSFRVEFVVTRHLRRCNWGKHWPISTQCVIYDNQRIIGVGEVVKHEKDKPDHKYARIYSAKKAFKQTRLWKEIRTRLWQKILTIQ